MQTFQEAIGHPLARTTVETVQVNVGKQCNQACHHCHVEAGPKRTETMDHRTAARVLSLLDSSPDVRTLDITGGAPELCEQFRTLVRGGHTRGLEVIDRCNLTILREPGQEDLARFLADHGVRIVASLPCYSRKNVEAQRGNGVFQKSIDGLKTLNELGYGDDLTLDLVYNPLGPSLPPPQAKLEAEYKTRLREDFGIKFNSLFTLTNMPIKRFAHALNRDGHASSYHALLVQSFNPATVDGLMCRTHISVGHEGGLYDCDFNQMLEMPLAAHRTIWDIESYGELSETTIATDAHCFGCTAGAGSSCGGALNERVPRPA